MRFQTLFSLAITGLSLIPIVACAGQTTSENQAATVPPDAYTVKESLMELMESTRRTERNVRNSVNNSQRGGIIVGALHTHVQQCEDSVENFHPLTPEEAAENAQEAEEEQQQEQKEAQEDAKEAQEEQQQEQKEAEEEKNKDSKTSSSILPLHRHRQRSRRSTPGYSASDERDIAKFVMDCMNAETQTLNEISNPGKKTTIQSHIQATYNLLLDLDRLMIGEILETYLIPYLPNEARTQKFIDSRSALNKAMKKAIAAYKT